MRLESLAILGARLQNQPFLPGHLLSFSGGCDSPRGLIAALSQCPLLAACGCHIHNNLHLAHALRNPIVYTWNNETLAASIGKLAHPFLESLEIQSWDRTNSKRVLTAVDVLLGGSALPRLKRVVLSVAMDLTTQTRRNIRRRAKKMSTRVSLVVEEARKPIFCRHDT